MAFRDDSGRAINHLRGSVTDRCNLRCVYCMPSEGVEKHAHTEMLHCEELALMVRAAAEIGTTKVRLTGGEPLVHRGRLDDVWAGNAATQAAGLTPIKFNLVVVGGLNDDEVVGFARKTLTDGWDVRFIELMPIAEVRMVHKRWGKSGEWNLGGA